jgi:hypothetical protein
MVTKASISKPVLRTRAKPGQKKLAPKAAAKRVMKRSASSRACAQWISARHSPRNYAN